MASAATTPTPTAGMKRGRDQNDDGREVDGPGAAVRLEKKARPSSGDSGTWPQDSVLNTPTAPLSHYTYQKPKYDSDDQSSMMSEPGSPQDLPMSDTDSEMLDDTAFFSQASSSLPPPSLSNTSSSPWRSRMSQQRVPTPIIPPSRSNVRSSQGIGSPRQHVRQRHPQEYSNSIAPSSDHLEVPSPIDEDEVDTPPSAAEAAGSQLSMLTFNDMEVETVNNVRLPSISIDRSATLPLPDEDGGEMEMGEDGRESRLVVRKQRQRSGALSSGQGSPVRSDPAAKRGLSMGYRHDCEKCRTKVVGHFNHFVS
ncbi:uncharacterized protein LTR77_005322 [Saxophila tyrrhenica]|uniref:Uncharacterized protein n=1 Tax=Saxophila tyrrhenica TaxID=1690608 RepID=A0AAV9P8S0_9PEZI|nr:hypothetical protein LTR77_005322 [Saxophila tyrrhenica]